MSAPRSSNEVVKAPKPPSSRNERRPSSIAAPSRSDWWRSAPGQQLVGDVVRLDVLGDEGVDIRVGRGIDRLDELVHAPRVDLHAEAQLGLGLVALGDGDVAHVVAEAGELERARRRPAGGGALPVLDLLQDGGVRHVADDGLAGDAEPGLDVAELAVAVRGLVEVHEVEVDVGPRQLDVRLRVQVQQRLLQRVEARRSTSSRG